MLSELSISLRPKEAGLQMKGGADREKKGQNERERWAPSY